MGTNPSNKLSLLPLFSLLCFISIFFVLSLSRRASLSSPKTHRSATVFPPSPAVCDYSDGSWIYDPRSARYTSSCKEIFKGWNCIANNKTNALDISNWRWKPKDCHLPSFDPLHFLHTHRNTNIGFVGDSLNRNMFVSLFCILKTVAGDLKKWRPAGADRGFTFLRYNLTIAYHRTNLLARYGRWSASSNGGDLEALGFKEGYRVDVDIPESSWAKAPSFHDILIFNTGHWWWAPSKFDPLKSPMLFFQGNRPILPPLPPAAGLDRVLSNMVNFVEKAKRPGGIIFFRTQSPRHFEGGDWDQGGSCQRLQPLLPGEVENLFSLRNNRTNVEVRLINQHLYNSLKSKSAFHVLDITHMSEYRADAHPAAAGGKNHDDCMHWCLPGLTDTWNDLFVATLHMIKRASFSSIQMFLFGRIDMRIKLIPGNSQGTVVAYYMSSDEPNRDEIDFEFLGNVHSQPYILQTNVYANGIDNREERIHLWSMVDHIPIRLYRNHTEKGVAYPRLQPMGVSWATHGGRDRIDACVWKGDPGSCREESTGNWWNKNEFSSLTRVQKRWFKWVRKSHLIYDYCQDYGRFHNKLPKECSLPKY